MPRLIGLGNNICGALDSSAGAALDSSAGAAPTLNKPTVVGRAESIQHHDWTCTVARGAGVSAWGTDPLVPSLVDFSGTGGITRVLATHDRPAALLSARRLALPPDWDAAGAEWDDAAVTDLGPAVGSRHNDGVYRFASLPDLCAGVSGVRLAHPYLRAEGVHLAASEARVLLLSGGHVLELLFDARGSDPRVVLLDAFEGLGVVKVVAGPGNRFALVTEAGEGYVLDALGGLEAVRVGVTLGGDDDEDESEVADLALGGGFELALVDGAVWARGDNAFGQLGVDGAVVSQWTRVPVAGTVLALHAGRMSSLLVVAD